MYLHVSVRTYVSKYKFDEDPIKNGGAIDQTMSNMGFLGSQARTLLGSEQANLAHIQTHPLVLYRSPER